MGPTTVVRKQVKFISDKRIMQTIPKKIFFKQKKCNYQYMLFLHIFNIINKILHKVSYK